MTPFQKHSANWINCTRCPLHKARKKVVLCKGQIPATVLFVGEAPGESEDVIGLPFVGPAGRLLESLVTQAWSDCGKQEPRTAWTNLVGCVPKEENTKRKRGEPLASEIETCYPRLEEFIRLCKPKLIVAVGSLATKQAEKQKWSTICKVASIVHPAAIIRQDVSQRGLSQQRCIVQLSDAFQELE